MNPADLAKFQERIGYSFNDPEVLKRAFIHASANEDDNDRLEFLGDAALGFAVSELMFQRYADVDVGILSEAKGRLVNNVLLSELAIDLGIDRLMSLGTSITQNGQSRSKVYADALEAVIGAIELDGGMDSVRQFVRDHIVVNFDINQSIRKHPKSGLQEWVEARGYDLPTYRVVTHEHVSGGEHWQVECTIEGLNTESMGDGRSKREAETTAAAKLLDQLVSNHG